MANIPNTSTMDRITDIALRPLIAASLSVAYDYLSDDRYVQFSLSNPVVQDALLVGAAVAGGEMLLENIENALDKRITNAAFKSLERTLLEPAVAGGLFTGGKLLMKTEQFSTRDITHSFVRGAALDAFSSYLSVPIKVAF